jgi:hypothetical protein
MIPWRPFRALAGALLALHYALHVRFTAGLMGPDGVWQGAGAGSGTLFGWLSAAELRLGTGALQALFGLGVVLGAAIAIGLAPRVCAAVLLVLGAVTYQALQPVVTLDDYFAQATAFWVILLPAVGTTGASGVAGASGRTGAAAVQAAGRRTPTLAGWSSLACLAFLFAVFLQYCLESPGLGPAACISIFTAAACAMAPIGVWRAVAAVPAVVALSIIAQLPGSAVGCGLALTLAGWALVDVSGWGSHRLEPRARTVDLNTGVGCAAVALVALHGLAGLGRVPMILRSTGLVLADMGLPWTPAVGTRGLATAALDVEFDAEGRGDVPFERLGVLNRRLQALLPLLDDATPATETTRTALLRRLVTRHCLDAKSPADGSPGQMSLVRDGKALRPTAWFQCRTDGNEPVVVPLKPT